MNNSNEFTIIDFFLCLIFPPYIILCIFSAFSNKRAEDYQFKTKQLNLLKNIDSKMLLEPNANKDINKKHEQFNFVEKYVDEIKQDLYKNSNSQKLEELRLQSKIKEQEIQLEEIKLKQRKLEIRQVYKNKIKKFIYKYYTFDNMFVLFLFILLLIAIYYFGFYLS